MKPKTVYRPPMYGHCGTGCRGRGRGFENNFSPTTPGRASRPWGWFIHRKWERVSWGWGKGRVMGGMC